VSNVVDMFCMFLDAASFDRQLGGAWATSTAGRGGMFQDSPGTIAGTTKEGDGTIQ